MSAWLNHVKKTMKLHPSKSFKEVLKLAKKTYKKGASTVKYAVTGKKTRKAKHTKSTKSKKGKTSKKRRVTKRSKSKGGGDSPLPHLTAEEVAAQIRADTRRNPPTDRVLANVQPHHLDKKN